MEPTTEAQDERTDTQLTPERLSFVDRYLKNSYAGERARLGETQPLVVIDLPEQHLKKHETMLKQSGFQPEEGNRRWTKLADPMSRTDADRLVREINGRPLEAYKGVRR